MGLGSVHNQASVNPANEQIPHDRTVRNDKFQGFFKQRPNRGHSQSLEHGAHMLDSVFCLLARPNVRTHFHFSL